MLRALPLATTFALGIGLSGLEHPLDWPPFWGLAAFALAFWTQGSARIFALAICLGAGVHLWTSHAHEIALQEHSDGLDDRVKEPVEGTIVGLPQCGTGGCRFALASKDNSRLLIYAMGMKAPDLRRFHAGTRVLFSASLRSPGGNRTLGYQQGRRQIMAVGADMVASVGVDEIEVLGFEWSSISWASWVHGWASSKLSASDAPLAGRGLVAAIALGDRSQLSEEELRPVRLAGIAHLVAVSGMHLGAIVLLVFWLANRFWGIFPWPCGVCPRSVAAGASMVAALAFSLVTGLRPSTMRALLVAMAVLLGVLLDRKIRMADALGGAAIIILAWRPTQLWDIGFQLSFAATISLLFLRSLRIAAQNETWQKKTGRYVAAVLLASLVTGVATTPLTLYHFGSFAPLGPVLNVIAIPLVAFVILPLSLLALLASIVWAPLGSALLVVSAYCAEFLLAIASVACELGSFERVAPLGLVEILSLVAVLPTLFVCRGRVRICLSLCLIGGFSCIRFGSEPSPSASLLIHFVDVGQGDATLIELPTGKVWLIDGGGRPFVVSQAKEPLSRAATMRLQESPAHRALLPLLRHLNIKEIDLAIVSHPHPDHYIGLRAVSRAIPIHRLWSAMPQASPLAQTEYTQWLAELARKGTVVERPRLGLAHQSGETALTTLWPRYESQKWAEPDPILGVNDNSLVVRLDFAGRRVLFAGDVEEEAEEMLVPHALLELRSDIVKVPHHGSKTSSTAAFVEAVSAQMAVISCGRVNRFGHPNPEVVNRWQAAGAKVFRTDLLGRITVRISPTGSTSIRSVAPMPATN